MLLCLKYLGYEADSNTNKTETMPWRGLIFSLSEEATRMVNQEEMDSDSFYNFSGVKGLY